MEVVATVSSAPGMKRATTTGDMPDKPSNTVTFQEGAGADGGKRGDFSRGHSEPYGREVRLHQTSLTLVCVDLQRLP